MRQTVQVHSLKCNCPGVILGYNVQHMAGRAIFQTTVFSKFFLTLLIFTCFAGLSCVPMPHPPRLPLPIVLANIEPLIVERRYNEALTVLETTGQNYPDSSLPFIKMGQIYLRQQRWFLAEDAFNRALARDLGNPWALTGLAQTLFNQGRLTDSWQVWQTLVSTRPQFPGGYHLLLF